MLTDRRPILLANARVVDPSRDFDGPGDVLIADGTIRDSQARHRRGRRPRRHRHHQLRRQDRRARADRHARLCRRARRQPPRNLCLRQPGGGRRRHHHHHLPAGHFARHRQFGDGRFRAAPRPRHRDRQHPSDGGADQGHARRGNDRNRAAESRRRCRLHRWRPKRDQCAGDAPGADLCPRFRRADRASHRRPRPGRRRRDERGRVRRPPRPGRHSQRGRSGHAGARHAPRRADRRALSRRLAVLAGVAGNPQARARCRPLCQRFGVDQPCHAERKRYRPLSDVSKTVAAAAHARRTAWRWSRPSPPA